MYPLLPLILENSTTRSEINSLPKTFNALSGHLSDLDGGFFSCLAYVELLCFSFNRFFLWFSFFRNKPRHKAATYIIEWNPFI